MDSLVQNSLHRFELLCDHWPAKAGRMEKRANYAYIWYPVQRAIRPPDQTKPILLTLQAITHGNEYGGIEVLLAFLELLAAGLLKIDQPMGFILGNTAAALAGRRFLEADLNRSFGQSQTILWEHQRAKELEPILEASLYYLDFHQTIEPTLSPFFIFPYTPRCYAFASALHLQLPIVTHWGQSFSLDGMCSDEFVNFRGGTGITLELGQKSFDPYHTGVGLQVALSAVQYAEEHGRDEKRVPRERPEAALYTWKSIVNYQEGMSLREGLVNFQELEKGEVIGTQAGQGELRTSEGGHLLFPKYRRDPTVSPAKELYRIAKKIAPEQLGQEGVLFR